MAKSLPRTSDLKWGHVGGGAAEETSRAKPGAESQEFGREGRIGKRAQKLRDAGAMVMQWLRRERLHSGSFSLWRGLQGLPQFPSHTHKLPQHAATLREPTTFVKSSPHTLHASSGEVQVWPFWLVLFFHFLLTKNIPEVSKVHYYHKYGSV